MERVTGIGGVFFKAQDPQALLEWYGTHLGMVPESDFTGVVFRWGSDEKSDDPGTTTWAIFSSDTTYFGPMEARGMINYRVEDLDRMLEQLRSAGVDVDPRVEDSEFGRFGWAVDGEGNRFELWQPAPGL
jgi:predicted enzyme related to lactoylglutathione lyase